MIVNRLLETGYCRSVTRNPRPEAASRLRRAGRKSAGNRNMEVVKVV